MVTKISRVLITGGDGFIGQHLGAALIKQGYQIYSYDLLNGEDINDAYQLSEVYRTFKPHVVFHLAAVSNRTASSRDPQQALCTNIIGTFNVLDFGKRYKIRTILASSAATAQPELSLYGTSKDCMEQIAKMFKDVIIARFYNVYGPGSKSVVNKFINNIKRGRKIKLNGNTVRDYIYVDDVVKNLIALMQAPISDYYIATKANLQIDQLMIRPGGLVYVDSVDNIRIIPSRRIYEIGTSVGTSLEDLVKLIEKVLDKKAIVQKSGSIVEIQKSICPESVFYHNSLRRGIEKLV